MTTPKEEMARAVRASRVVAGIDFVIALVCAMNGLPVFVFFIVLGGLMWMTGAFFKGEMDKLGD